MPSSPEEKQLIAGLKSGQIKYFEKILSVYEKKIFNYIYRLCGSRPDAEDLTQETFIKLFNHRSLINPDGNFKGWLYTIATNTVYDWLRKKKRRQELFIIDDDESPFETIDEGAAYKNIEVKNDIETALRKLKPVYRTSLWLFYKEGFDYEDIARILNSPVNTVKTYLRRGREALKKELGENYYES